MSNVVSRYIVLPVIDLYIARIGVKRAREWPYLFATTTPRQARLLLPQLTVFRRRLDRRSRSAPSRNKHKT